MVILREWVRGQTPGLRISVHTHTRLSRSWRSAFHIPPGRGRAGVAGRVPRVSQIHRVVASVAAGLFPGAEHQ